MIALDELYEIDYLDEMNKKTPAIVDEIAAPDDPGRILLSGGGSASFEVSLPRGTFDQLVTNRGGVTLVMQTLGAMVADSAANHRPSRFSVLIDREGATTVITTADDDDLSVPDNQPPSSFDAARARGRLAAAKILAGDDMLTAEALADRLGVTRATIHNRRERHAVLGLEGAKRGYRYPAWQFDAQGRAYPELPQLFDLLGPDPWSVFRFLVQRHAALGGISARDALAASRGPEVLAAAQAVRAGDFA